MSVKICDRVIYITVICNETNYRVHCIRVISGEKMRLAARAAWEDGGSFASPLTYSPEMEHV